MAKRKPRRPKLRSQGPWQVTYPLDHERLPQPEVNTTPDQGKRKLFLPSREEGKSTLTQQEVESSSIENGHMVFYEAADESQNILQ